MRIAAWQALSTPADPTRNLARLDDISQEARAEGADLLITPEMFLTGYNLDADMRSLAAGEPLERARAIARRHHLGLVVGGPEIDGDRVRNSAWLIDDDGDVLAKHQKIQMFGPLDRRLFAPGEAPSSVANFRGVKIGLLICFDVEFPEHPRAAALAGAKLLAVPTAQMRPFEFVNDSMIATRAYENRVFVAYANQTGAEGGFDYVGRSVIASPFGETLARASDHDEELLLADLDLTLIERSRLDSDYLHELRRPVRPEEIHS